MEDKFLTPLRVEKLGERTWILLDNLVFQTKRFNGVFIAPRGFQTNFASIPRFAYILFPPIGNYDWAAVIHDASYGDALLTEDGNKVHLIKKFSDEIFLDGMKCKNVNKIVRRFMYRAVVLFGNPNHGR